MAAYSARTRRRRRNRVLSRVVAVLLILGAAYFIYLDFTITSHFEGARWQVPSRVYARPLELYSQQAIRQNDLVSELSLINYKRVGRVSKPGQYAVTGNSIEVFLRSFTFWDGEEPQRHIRIVLNENVVSHITDISNGEPVDILRLEPMFIGAMYPRKREDRVLVKLEDVPGKLIETLLLVEDKNFYQHSGIAPASIVRALIANIKAGRKVQGGSTITQQLVKNFYLSNDKSYLRKINEAFMALLLELHYEKDEILEAYINEIYLGQEGRRSIHGFGLASHFYFAKPLNELEFQELALMVALVKGASFYDPRRFPERSRERRNIILDTLYKNKKIDQQTMLSLKSSPLGVTSVKPIGMTPFPAFLDVVSQQLVRDYDAKDLRSEGLKVFTTLDPLIQRRAEQIVRHSINSLERDFSLSEGQLETAMVVARRHSAEIQAVIGGARPGFAGLNRAASISRAIGSLVKPAVYLSALEDSEQYHLATMIDDSPVELKLDANTVWSPKNYDGEFHGQVPMYAALANSYNLAAVKLGLDIGVDRVNEMINRLGVDKSLDEYPANLLGAVELAPLDVAQMFQTLADGGYLSPLRAIRSVTTGDGNPLKRYGIETRKVVADEQSFMMHVAMQNVVKSGTAKALNVSVKDELNVAGKTGTTNDKRDSWFAGYGNDFVGVVWLGRDDFKPTPFTGSTGAMKIWGRLFGEIEQTPLQLERPPGIEFITFDPEDGKRLKSNCYYGVDIPVVEGTVTDDEGACTKGNILDRTRYWLRKVF